jgi:lipid-A-disaccharide synthase
MQKRVVTELIQDQLTANNLAGELTSLLSDPDRIREIKEDYSALQQRLHTGGEASSKAADIICHLATGTTSSASAESPA